MLEKKEEENKIIPYSEKFRIENPFLSRIPVYANLNEESCLKQFLNYFKYGFLMGGGYGIFSTFIKTPPPIVLASKKIPLRIIINNYLNGFFKKSLIFGSTFGFFSLGTCFSESLREQRDGFNYIFGSVLAGFNLAMIYKNMKIGFGSAIVISISSLLLASTKSDNQSLLTLFGDRGLEYMTKEKVQFSEDLEKEKKNEKLYFEENERRLFNEFCEKRKL
jgi:hypothetical protein